MDRFKLIFSSLVLLQIGCAKESSSIQSKFPETVQGCLSSAHQSRYLVRKTDGTFEKIYAKSRQEMIDSYVLPNLEKIDFVEQDQKIELSLPNAEISAQAVADTWGPDRIKTSAAWNAGFFGQGVVVAVVDSGTELTHSGIKDNLYQNLAELNGVAGVDDDNNGFIDDFSGYNFAADNNVNIDEVGHGTHVAGIISANNSLTPHKSVAPQSKVLPLDFMKGGSGFTSDAIASIDYAVQMGARIINASWGSSGCSSALKDKINELENHNVLFVVAAGNSGNDITFAPEYPAANKTPVVLTVGSMTVSGFQSSFSNFGALVDLVAPGSQILSSYKGNTYVYLDGTSMATPMVSGVAALLLSARPATTATNLKNILEASVRVGNYAVKTHGEIDVEKALQLILAQ